MKNYSLIRPFLIISIMVLLDSCSSIPKGAEPVKPFYIQKYLGKWFEIARLDFRFEKDLSDVTANYSLKNNGSVKVDNKGYDFKNNKWKQSIGNAKFAGTPDEGKLKVSFFGPFYAGYNVIAVDTDYKYALVAGSSLDYLWILSREKSIPEDIKNQYLNLAKEIGYNTDQLIWVEHTRD